MPRSYISLNYHLVFGTKRRFPMIREEVESDLYSYIGGTLRHLEGKLLAAGGTPDHIHLLVSLSQKHALMDVVRIIKANSSRWLHGSVGQLGFRWQNGYGAFSVSKSGIEPVTRYIARQKIHHQTESFEEELIRFFEKYGIPYDIRDLLQ